MLPPGHLHLHRPPDAPHPAGDVGSEGAPGGGEGDHLDQPQQVAVLQPLHTDLGEVVRILDHVGTSKVHITMSRVKI